ncbi:uncharacterized protein LOC108319553 [Vigna angularis]|uniref:uncharacterized protein LOC108319553 n=1 Tax=Phaseolus angularis TaxID=3914 RepID=UPI0008099F1D|nr:uncharacterized protein LOC108319553 [Vigna angularis]
MQQKHAEEIATLKAERGRIEQSAQHAVLTTERDSNHENENDGSRNQQPSQHTNPNGRERREPTPLRTVRPTSLLPFTVTIMQTPMPEKNPPTLEKYDGSTDPDNYLRIFINAMAFYTDNDPIICRAFSLSLKDEALKWYNTLPPNIVDCFATEETLFRRQYTANRRQEITPTKLVNTKQENDKTLKAFMKRYNEVVRRVKDVNHTFIISNLPSCLRPGYFAEKIYVRPPKTMDELLERIDEFVRMEDMRSSRKKQQQEASACSSEKGKVPRSKDFSRTPRFTYYTTLNAPRAEILNEALNVDLLSVKNVVTPRNTDGRKHCQYHQNREHTTQECVTLKDDLEKLIRERHLRKYVKQEKTQVRSPARESPEPSYRKEERRRRRSCSRSHNPDRITKSPS